MKCIETCFNPKKRKAICVAQKMLKEGAERKLLKDLNDEACAAIGASFEIERGPDGHETPESFVARMEATKKMAETFARLAQIPGSGVQVFNMPMDDAEVGYSNFLHGEYVAAQAQIAAKNADTTTEKEPQ